MGVIFVTLPEIITVTKSIQTMSKKNKTEGNRIVKLIKKAIMVKRLDLKRCSAKNYCDIFSKQIKVYKYT